MWAKTAFTCCIARHRLRSHLLLIHHSGFLATAMAKSEREKEQSQTLTRLLKKGSECFESLMLRQAQQNGNLQ
jgi:hypothetical protein